MPLRAVASSRPPRVGGKNVEIKKIRTSLNANKIISTESNCVSFMIDVFYYCREYTYFYIKQSYGRWSIGYQYGDEIASVYDDDVYEIKYVGIKSAKWSQWSLYWPGFGKYYIQQSRCDLHHLSLGYTLLHDGADVNSHVLIHLELYVHIFVYIPYLHARLRLYPKSTSLSCPHSCHATLMSRPIHMAIYIYIYNIYLTYMRTCARPYPRHVVCVSMSVSMFTHTHMSTCMSTLLSISTSTSIFFVHINVHS